MARGVRIKKNYVINVLLGVVLFLLIGNVVSHIVNNVESISPKRIYLTLYGAFDFNSEYNFPSYFSSVLFLLNALFLLMISFEAKLNLRNRWLILSGVFAFLAVDEMLRVHEHLIEPMRNLFDTSGVLYFAWVIPYIVFIVLLGVYMLKFVLNLPERTRNFFIISAVLFVSGAVGMELIGGNYAEFNGEDSSPYFVMYTIEEVLEMTGLCLFCYGLMDYLSMTRKKVKLIF